MAGSTGVVIAALIANGAIAILKFGGFLLTGSPSMLSETYHSISDTGNQVFLLVGIKYSDQKADRTHPFGYGKAQFFYSFLVSVLLFGIAGWESLKHGYDAVVHGGHATVAPVSVAGTQFPAWYVNVVVLLAAIGFETYAFKKASDELKRQIREYEWNGIRDAFRKTSDVTTLTAYTEDAIALAGAIIALVGITLTQWTGNHIFDAIGAVLIGILLMGFSVALAWENKRLILGESLPQEVEEELRGIIREHPGVVRIDGFSTVFVGPQDILITANVGFDGGSDTDDLDADISEIEKKLRAHDDRVNHIYIEPER